MKNGIDTASKPWKKIRFFSLILFGWLCIVSFFLTWEYYTLHECCTQLTIHKKKYEYYTALYQRMLEKPPTSSPLSLTPELVCAEKNVEQKICASERPKEVRTQHKKQVDRFSWPMEQGSFWLSSKFGPRKKGYHYGIDMASPKGTPVKSTATGIITEVTYSPKGYGKNIVISHVDGIHQSRYAHLQEILVKVGQYVKAGVRIGSVGDTGSVRGENGGKMPHIYILKSRKMENMLIL